MTATPDRLGPTLDDRYATETTIAAGVRGPSDASTTRRRPWSRTDTVVLTLVTALAAVIRGVRLSTPPFIYSDELFYPREACNDVFQSPSICGIPLDAVSGHPPLGKWLISLGIRAFGWQPIGWRIPGLVAGTLTVALLYVLARRLLGSTRGATLAAGLLAIDFLHIVQSRIAMLDVFLTLFVVASFTFVVLDHGDHGDASRVRAGRRSGVLARPWLLAAGLAAGAAVATKWNGVLALLGVAGLCLVWMASPAPGERRYATLLSAVRRWWLPLVIALAVAPPLVYLACYAGRIDGRVLALPWARGSWARNFAHVQREMLESHLYGQEAFYVGKTNPYVSPAWSWPLIRRPMAYYSHEDAGSRHVRIMAMGNPLTWWAALVALAYLGLQLVGRRRTDAAVVTVTGFALMFVPLLLMSSARAATFLYYMLPSVPFMCLALATVASDRRRVPGWIVVAFMAAAVALLAFFYPVLTGLPLSGAAVEARLWFRDCQAGSGIAAPAGWCWQ